MIIETLVRAKKTCKPMEESLRDFKGQRFSPACGELVNIQPILWFYSRLRKEAEWAEKYVTFNEYVRVLAQLFQFSFVETHFYS